MASLVRVVTLASPGNAPHAAPSAAPPAAMAVSVNHVGAVPPRRFAASMAPTEPISSWPSPPRLNNPARAGTAVARAASRIGVARMKVSPRLSLLPAAVSHIDDSTSPGSAPLAIRKAEKIASVEVATTVQRRAACPARPLAIRRHSVGGEPPLPAAPPLAGAPTASPSVGARTWVMLRLL